MPTEDDPVEQPAGEAMTHVHVFGQWVECDLDVDDLPLCAHRHNDAGEYLTCSVCGMDRVDDPQRWAANTEGA